MRKYVKVTLFISLFFVLLMLSGDLFMPKRRVEIAVDNFHDEHCGLYVLDDNTIDVLYIGSSHVFSSISPEDIWYEYGITGYVQASSCQKVWQSYYYLEEMLYTQKPKVVILDTFMVLDGAPQSEAFNREAIDKLAFSLAKIKSIYRAVANNPIEEDFLSYIFPIIRYHDRWDELLEQDYKWFFTGKNAPAKGFLPRIGCQSAVFNFDDYTIENIQTVEINELCEEYLNKIKGLCEKNDITLVLVKFPTCLWNLSNSKAIEKWAEQNSISFLDYNSDSSLRESVDIDWSTDSLDGGNHLNYAGAMKMTKEFGKYLMNSFNFKDKRHSEEYEQWDTDYEYYKRCVENYELSSCQNLNDYVKRLRQGKYSVAMSLNNIGEDAVHYYIKSLEELNISEQFLNDSVGKSNIIIINNGDKLFERIYTNTLLKKENIDGNNWILSSKIDDIENTFRAIILKKEYLFENKGVSFIVWDSTTQNVVDSCTFFVDTDGEFKRSM